MTILTLLVTRKNKTKHRYTLASLTSSKKHLTKHFDRALWTSQNRFIVSNTTIFKAHCCVLKAIFNFNGWILAAPPPPWRGKQISFWWWAGSILLSPGETSVTFRFCSTDVTDFRNCLPSPTSPVTPSLPMAWVGAAVVWIKPPPWPATEQIWTVKAYTEGPAREFCFVSGLQRQFVGIWLLPEWDSHKGKWSDHITVGSAWAARSFNCHDFVYIVVELAKHQGEVISSEYLRGKAMQRPGKHSAVGLQTAGWTQSICRTATVIGFLEAERTGCCASSLSFFSGHPEVARPQAASQHLSSISARNLQNETPSDLFFSLLQSEVLTRCVRFFSYLMSLPLWFLSAEDGRPSHLSGGSFMAKLTHFCSEIQCFLWWRAQRWDEPGASWQRTI